MLTGVSFRPVSVEPVESNDPASIGADGYGPIGNDRAIQLMMDIVGGRFTFGQVEPLFDNPTYLPVEGGQVAMALGFFACAALDEACLDSDGRGDWAYLRFLLTPDRLEWIGIQMVRTLVSAERSGLFGFWAGTSLFDEWADSCLHCLSQLSTP